MPSSTMNIPLVCVHLVVHMQFHSPSISSMCLTRLLPMIVIYFPLFVERVLLICWTINSKTYSSIFHRMLKIHAYITFMRKHRIITLLFYRHFKFIQVIIYETARNQVKRYKTSFAIRKFQVHSNRKESVCSRAVYAELTQSKWKKNNANTSLSVMFFPFSSAEKWVIYLYGKLHAQFCCGGN